MAQRAVLPRIEPESRLSSLVLRLLLLLVLRVGRLGARLPLHVPLPQHLGDGCRNARRDKRERICRIGGIRVR